MADAAIARLSRWEKQMLASPKPRKRALKGL